MSKIKLFCVTILAVIASFFVANFNADAKMAAPCWTECPNYGGSCAATFNETRCTYLNIQSNCSGNIQCQN